MTRETAEGKAGRLLVEGAVVVRLAVPEQVTATVRGTSGQHEVSWGRGGWFCTCPARSTCSHLLAVERVTAPTRAGGTR